MAEYVGNQITNSSDAKYFLAKLGRFIELYDNNMTAVEIINEMRLYGLFDFGIKSFFIIRYKQ